MNLRRANDSFFASVLEVTRIPKELVEEDVGAYVFLSSGDFLHHCWYIEKAVTPICNFTFGLGVISKNIRNAMNSAG